MSQASNQSPEPGRQRGLAARDPGTLRSLYERTILTWRLIWDKRVGWLPKVIPLGALVYAISPLDLAPVIFLGPLAPLGVLDDAGILLLALSLFVKACPPDVVQEHLLQLGRVDSVKPPYPDQENIVDGDVEILD